MRKTLVLALLALTALMPGATRVPLAHAAGSCIAGDTKVSIVNFAFQPATITVPLGTTVCWTNNGSVNHSATSDNPAFDSSTLASGDSFRFTFSSNGSFPYHCNFHPLTMMGTITAVFLMIPRPP